MEGSNHADKDPSFQVAIFGGIKIGGMGCLSGTTVQGIEGQTLTSSSGLTVSTGSSPNFNTSKALTWNKRRPILTKDKKKVEA
jgi:hypothetical protein